MNSVQGRTSDRREVPGAGGAEPRPQVALRVGGSGSLIPATGTCSRDHLLSFSWVQVGGLLASPAEGDPPPPGLCALGTVGAAGGRRALTVVRAVAPVVGHGGARPAAAARGPRGVSAAAPSRPL